ncbi:YcaO-like family protein [Psychromonas hadalis]|uniref:YcaO-like family protein n=1 Tax=Psychromonas hadalis TaxID=211669 RepID=UPI0003B59B8A|nr:YcaO-like family protein [Psychromonas hadalis]
MTEILNWHAKFNVFNLESGDILLLSEMQSLSLPQTQFANFRYIDGLRSVDDLIAIIQGDNQDVATFLYQVGKLKKQQLLVDIKQTDLARFVNQHAVIPESLLLSQHYAVISLTANSAENTTLWLDCLANVELPVAMFITFILCDDLLNPTLLHEVAKHNAVCLIKITGDQIRLLSLLGVDNNYDYLQKLQTRLKHNNPTLHLAQSLYPESAVVSPYQLNLTFNEKLCSLLQQQLTQQLNHQGEQLTIINRASGEVEHHPIRLLATNQQDFKSQILTHIKLTSCIAVFNKDGGSRTRCPQKTVDSIQPFISPITGLITHLQPLATSVDKPVKIYTSAFFKKPAFKRAFNIENDSFVHQCMGKGVSHSQSQASALCEAIERYSAHFQGDEPLFLSKPEQLTQRHYDFQQLVPYSESQYQQFSNENHPDSLLKQAALIYQHEAVHWLPTWSLTFDEQVYVPLTHCFANIPFDDDIYARWHSNGCAAGNTLEEAILQALFELIERDAIAIWWYNRILRPAYDLAQLDKKNLQALDETLTEHDYWVLDLTHDIGVSVMVAIGQHKQNKGLSFGFGCHLQSELAAQRALTELCQLIPIREQKDAPFDFDAVQQDAFLFVAETSPTQGQDFQSSGDLKIDIEAIVAKLRSLGLETLVLNYSRAPLPIKTAKVFVPGLCHIWPQLANQRLYQVPVDMGWLAVANCEQSINQHALYV